MKELPGWSKTTWYHVGGGQKWSLRDQGPWHEYDDDNANNDDDDGEDDDDQDHLRRPSAACLGVQVPSALGSS